MGAVIKFGETGSRRLQDGRVLCCNNRCIHGIVITLYRETSGSTQYLAYYLL